MAKYRAKVVMFLDIDTESYIVPTDFKLKDSLKDDIVDAVCGQIDVELEDIAITQLIRLEKNNNEYYD